MIYYFQMEWDGTWHDQFHEKEWTAVISYVLANKYSKNLIIKDNDYFTTRLAKCKNNANTNLELRADEVRPELSEKVRRAAVEITGPHGDEVVRGSFVGPLFGGHKKAVTLLPKYLYGGVL